MREELLSISTKKQHKILKEGYKNLSLEDRQKFEVMAIDDKSRYRKQKES